MALVVSAVLLAVLLGAAPAQAGAADGSGAAGVPEPLVEGAARVAVIPIRGNIEPGLTRFVERALREARAAGADLIFLEVNTFGGRVDAATDIRDALLNEAIPVAAWVRERAWSAGALITLAADRIVMAPGSSIGAAEPRPADEKTISALAAEFASTARANGRDARVAEAMVDASVQIEGLVAAGKILTLGADRAADIGFADGVAGDRAGTVRLAGVDRAEWIEIEPSAAERVARFVTDPTVSQLLLTLGMLGLVFELTTVGWGIGGSVALLALGLFFGGHLIAGLTGWESIALFVGGLVLLLIELFVVPGFGVVGGLGIVATLAGLFLVFPDPGAAVGSLSISLLATAAVVAIFFKFFPKRSPLRHLVLRTELTDEDGYFAPTRRDDLVGKEGRTLTRLRPAGTVLVDGERVDAVSEGSWIDVGSPVRVVTVEGARVVVRKTESAEGTDAAD